jgi:hypothetical protein
MRLLSHSPLLHSALLLLACYLLQVTARNCVRSVQPVRMLTDLCCTLVCVTAGGRRMRLRATSGGRTAWGARCSCTMRRASTTLGASAAAGQQWTVNATDDCDVVMFEGVLLQELICWQHLCLLQTMCCKCVCYMVPPSLRCAGPLRATGLWQPPRRRP